MEPIAKRLEQSAEYTNSSACTNDDVSERIRKLEVELNELSGSSSELSDESVDEDTRNFDAIVNLSTLQNERIRSLPESLLPKKNCASGVERRTKVKNRSSACKLDSSDVTKKVPFACKSCCFVGKNLEEFNVHNMSEGHLQNVQSKINELYCKICDKKITSESQLVEHRKGKWHQMRANRKRERHVVKTCYDFLRGQCTRGESCVFDHTLTKAIANGKAFEKKKRIICKKFRDDGECKFGDLCLYSHSFQS
jgi:uncharacterized protein YeeX (DUF496 family)